MGFADKLKDVRKKAEETVVEHKGQIQQAVAKAGAAVDSRTGGKYHERIQKAEGKADAIIDKLDPDEASPHAEPPQPGSRTEP